MARTLSRKELRRIFDKPTIEKMGFEADKRLVVDYKNKSEWVTIGGKSFWVRAQIEKKVAEYLELLKQAGQIKEWSYEFMNFKFPPNTDKPVDSWLVDFTITENDGNFYHIEAKGHFRADDRKKLRLLFEHYPQARVLFVFWQKDDIKKMGLAVDKYCWWREPITLNQLTRGLI